MSDEIDAIVKGLSARQKKALKRETPKLPDEDWEELEGMGITGEDGWIDVFTDLGLAVRARLTQANGGGDA